MRLVIASLPYAGLIGIGVGVSLLLGCPAAAAPYVGLFLAAAIPPMLGRPPFTVMFSKSRYPTAVTSSPLFHKVNLVINYVWAGVFALAFGLALMTYSDHAATQLWLQNGLPVLAQLGVGLPVTLLGPGFLTQRLAAPPMRFATNRDMFAAMPFGLNKRKAEGIDTVVQFHLTGTEELEGHLTIEDQACTFTNGVHPSPKTTIRSDSDLWLGISNGETSGDKAYLENRYSIEGDAAILLKFQDLFTNDSPPRPVKLGKRLKATRRPPFAYATFPPRKIQRVVVINGSNRSSKFSKSSLMADSFVAGAETAGAQVETVWLKGKKINYCQGCYTCWTKTPGVCIYRDDMAELLEKVRAADLVVYVSPLYVYSIAAPLKVFLDRLLPNIKPYMVSTDGLTHHPARFKTDPEQGFVIFSAGGFPEVEGNFDGIRAIMRSMSTHGEKTKLMAEFYLPAAELLSIPVYRERRERTVKACFQAGVEAVEKGVIEQRLTDIVADPGVGQATFMEQANVFWETLDGKKAYLKEVPPLPEARPSTAQAS